MGEMFNVDYMSYRNILGNINTINSGDMVYLISDVLELAKIARLHGEKFNPHVFLDSLIERVGPKGTILVPTFNWDFCDGKTYDYYKTMGKTGALGNAALKHEKFERTQHPIYSFAVYGDKREELVAIDQEDCFGEKTVFDYLYKNQAKALVIGLNALEGLTMVHYVEQLMGVPYRYFKEFTGEYIDRFGNKQKKKARMYVRDLEIDPQENMEHLSQILEDLNISNTKIINDVPFRTVYLRQACKIIEMDIQLNESKNLYDF